MKINFGKVKFAILKNFYFNYVVNNNNLFEEEEVNLYPNKIWTMWLQGYDNSPDIVKACINSIKKFSDGKEVIILDENNIKDYIEIPPHILAKYKKGYIGSAHFSDYIRTVLLYKYGGTWMDSTIYCTDNFNFILKNNFVILQNPFNNGVSNFFIHAEKNCLILKYMYLFLTLYWKHNNIAFDYFFWHKFFVFLVKKDKHCKKIFEENSIYLNLNAHMLVKEVTKNISPERLEYLKRISPIHKLTYKKKVKFAKADLSIVEKDSLYNKIIKDFKEGK